MSNLSRPQSECDECGKRTEKFFRVHNGHRYCGTCYAREFKRRICPKCGNYARLLRSQPDAVCSKCEVDKPCARCGKTEFTVGKITHYGPVCNACAPYFRELEPCEECGTHSPRLTRVNRMGHSLRLCPKCARSDHATCQACGRNRLLIDSPDGKRLCRICLENGEIPCPVCKELMPSGQGKQCQHCYWSGLLIKRIAIDVAAFTKPAMASHFDAFGQWLGLQVGAHKASLTIHRYLDYFLAVEREWGEIPNYQLLLKQFGSAGLRKVLLPVRWMTEVKLICPDSEAKEKDSESRRIQAMLERFAKDSNERQTLTGYYKQMLARNVKTRSVRLALTPAVALLSKSQEYGKTLPDQLVLEGFLATAPGQRAAVSGFVRFLRESCGATVVIPPFNKEKAHAKRKKKLQDEMIELMRQGVNAGGQPSRRWLSVALAYFHGLPKNATLLVKDEDIHLNDKGGVSIFIAGKSYWIPIYTEASN